MVLTGYDLKGNQFFNTNHDLQKNGSENHNIKKHLIPVKSAQIEAVKIISKLEFWITSESESNGKPRLFKLKLEP